jgi:hypothetical protein
MTVRICLSCGATSVEAAFAPKVKGRLAPKLCLDCTAAAERGDAPPHRSSPTTRASYRAAWRHRQKQDQRDLVDLLAPPP